jgi:Protein of unknown function (DUF3987)
VLPAITREKRPAIQWKKYQDQLPKITDVNRWFSGKVDALCVVTGKVSGNLELLDFDHGGDLFERWFAAIDVDLRARLVIETSQSGGRHVTYRCSDPVDGNLKLAHGNRDGKLVTLIETRGEGGLFLCSPTPGYNLLQGRLVELPTLTTAERESLLMAAWQLNEQVEQTAHFIPVDETRPGDEFNERGDVVELLKRHGWTPGETHADGNQHWTRPGKDSGTSATLKDRVFFVFSSNAVGLEAGKAYSPFVLFAALEHSNDFEAAARALGLSGFGNHGHRDNLASIHADPSPKLNASSIDPGRLPEHLFHVPGFIDEVMRFTLANAPYPNVGLAFCGAVALQSFLTGRKVCTSGDLRTNIYLLALASSGTGKEFPRKVNSHVLKRIGMAASLGDKFASGEGIQDALIRSGKMLFQNDEMDGVLRQINGDQDNRRESIPNILLTLYTSAGDLYPTRVKANQKEPILVDQPHLTLFGTATPQYFYESLSRRMLTNGFFARLCIIDVGRRSEGQKPGSARDVPESILEVAKWWADFEPGTGNFLNFHPAPQTVPFEHQADEALTTLRCLTESEYSKAEEANDEVARTAWSRTTEQATKLALIYACSENHESPRISLNAVRWATEVAMHQTRRQLFLAGVHVADNPFHAECLKVLKILRERPDQAMARRELMRAMRCKAADFDQVIGTLTQWDEVELVSLPSATKPALGYRII